MKLLAQIKEIEADMAVLEQKLIPRNIGCAFLMIKQKSFAKLLYSDEPFVKNHNVRVPMSLYES